MFNKAEINTNINLEECEKDKIILINDVDNVIYDEIGLITQNNYNINDIFSIKTKISFNDIFVFDTLKQYKTYYNIQTFFVIYKH